MTGRLDSEPSTTVTWVCRGWPESLEPPRSVKHQWMHGYHAVPVGEACSICEATQDDPDRWDGVSNPFPVGVAAPEEVPVDAF